MRRTLLVAVLVAALASCGASTPPQELYPGTTTLRNIERLSDGESYTFTTGCHGANRVYLRGNSIAAIANDPTCAIGPIR